MVTTEKSHSGHSDEARLRLALDRPLGDDLTGSPRQTRQGRSVWQHHRRRQGVAIGGGRARGLAIGAVP